VRAVRGRAFGEPDRNGRRRLDRLRRASLTRDSASMAKTASR
jgi:hypothetical protein